MIIHFVARMVKEFLREIIHSVLAALVVTVILFVMPRSPEQSSRNMEYMGKSYSFNHDIVQKNDNSSMVRSQNTNLSSYFQNEIQSGLAPGEVADDVTLVTAFINIGSFKKGRAHRNETTYRKWMRAFSKIHNPVVVFFDSDYDKDYFTDIRSNGSLLARTKIVMVDKNTTWAFGLIPKFTSVYSQEGYPRHVPDTTVPEYAVVQHMKYEFVHKAASDNPFRTKYFAWVDIGLFRAEKSSNPPFRLYLPPGMDTQRIAYDQVRPYKNYTKKGIFFRHKFWVCGCFFIGERQKMIDWTRDYMKYEEQFLSEGLANSDQQTVFAIAMHEYPSVGIQAFRPNGTKRTVEGGKWFNLAYKCKVTVDK